MPLSSKLFTDDPVVRTRLQDCADFDAKHIEPFSQKGEWISRIQQALKLAMPDVAIDSDEITNQFYGASTARAVIRFKDTRLPKILNFRNQLDDIVGIKTIKALDEIARQKQPVTPVPLPSKFQDVVIHILGFDPTDAKAGKKNETGTVGSEETEVGVPSLADVKALANNDQYKALHEDLIAEHWFGGGGAANPASDPTDSIVKSVTTQLAGKTRGHVMIVGYSIGGRNAVTVARKLSAADIFVSYVGIADAAFNDSADPALNGPVVCGLGQNFFQSTTNSGINHAPFEFHGAVAGLRTVDFDGTGEYAKEKETDQLREPGLRNGRRFFDKLHKLAVKDGLASIEPTMKALLTGTLVKPR